MGLVERFPGLPPAAAARLAAKVLARHSPDEIAAAIELLIDVLDIFGGDIDAEDATDLEDDFRLSDRATLHGSVAPGCVVTEPHDPTAVEWHTLRRGQQHGPMIASSHEDEEDDDPSGQCDEDGVNTNLRSLRRAHGAGCEISDPGGDWASEEQPGGFHLMPHTWVAGPGCAISDPGGTPGLDS